MPFSFSFQAPPHLSPTGVKHCHVCKFYARTTELCVSFQLALPYLSALGTNGSTALL